MIPDEKLPTYVWYFAYGSNMNIRRLSSRIGGMPLEARPCRAHGWQFRFNKVGRDQFGEAIAYANVMKRENSVTEGVAFLIPMQALARIDVCEGRPFHYYRRMFQVETRHGMLWTVGYKAQQRQTRRGLLPTEAYLNHILAGAKYLSGEYCEWLRTHEYWTYGE